MYHNSFEQYFVPRGAGALAEDDVSAAVGVHGEYVCAKRCVIKRIKAIVTSAVAADTTLPVVEMNRRSAPGVAAGEVLLGNLTIPDLTAAGQVLFKDITPLEFLPGQALSLEHVTQAVDGGGAAGLILYSFEIEDKPEEDTEISSLVESA